MRKGEKLDHEEKVVERRLKNYYKLDEIDEKKFISLDKVYSQQIDDSLKVILAENTLQEGTGQKPKIDVILRYMPSLFRGSQQEPIE